MTEYIPSDDGTRIACDIVGDGPPVILIGGAMQFRAFAPATGRLAQLLAERGFTAVHYDRRGRGETTSAAIGPVERELEDVAALIDRVGGGAALFGHSSGGAIALLAAHRGLDVSRVAVFEVPLPPSRSRQSDAYRDDLVDLVNAGDHEAATEFFMKDMPPEWLAAAKAGPAWPTMVGMAPSLVADADALAFAYLSPQEWARFRQSVLLMVGKSTRPIFTEAAEALASKIPNTTSRVIAAREHSWEPQTMADVLADFFSGR
jgi:pimeloyl-ACP methyl ester carboxylesterase